MDCLSSGVQGLDSKGNSCLLVARVDGLKMGG